jgi:hypothetical protein
MEEHLNIWEKCDFLAASSMRGSGVVVVTVSLGGPKVQESSHGSSDGGAAVGAVYCGDAEMAQEWSQGLGVQ